MGLLDDAIRQHLELKRRHGADPGDVAKLEHEAFGPVEREDALAVPSASEAPPVAFDHEADRAANASVAHEEEVAYEESELEAEEDWSASHAQEPRAPQGAGSVRLEDAEPAPATPPQAREPEGEPGEHDELEETPDFLQETPEHDRLWFEQKPPRDFDF